MIWDELTYEEINNLDRNIPVVLVLAATEQHGPHLPLATDRIIGEYFAHALHLSMQDRVLVLPSAQIGCSSHHMDFTGSLSLQHNTFFHYVSDIVQSVIQHGFKKIILLNSHGGNQAIGQVLLEKLGFRYPSTHFVLATWWHIAADQLKEITESGFGGVGHACEFETSVMLIAAPHLVRTQRIPGRGNKATFAWAESDMLNGPRAAFYRTIKEMTDSGVFGEPSAASAGKGEKIKEVVLNTLITIVSDLFNAADKHRE